MIGTGVQELGLWQYAHSLKLRLTSDVSGSDGSSDVDSSEQETESELDSDSPGAI